MNKRPSPFSADEFQHLSKVRVIYLATVRKDGTQSKAAPLWFITTPEQTILIQSGPDSWHSRRIRRGSPAIVWVRGYQPSVFIGKAEITDDPTAVERIIDEYRRKYLMARLGIHRPTRWSFQRGQRVAIEITPVQRLPNNLKSQPGAAAPSFQ